MDIKYSEEMNYILAEAHELAKTYHSQQIGLEHLMVCLLRYPGESVTKKIFSVFQIDLDGLRTRLEQMLEMPDSQADNPVEKIPMSVQAQGRLHLSYLFSKQYRSEAVESYHLVLAILKPAQLDSQNTIKMLLGQAGITFETFEDELRHELHLSDSLSAAGQFQEEDDENERRTVRKGKDAGKSATPMLDSFGKDLTKMAAEGKIDPVVGRQKELERIAQILCRRKKNNPVLIGEPGVGKSALAEGLALQITSGHVSRTLLHKRIVSLDMAGLVLLADFRNDIETHHARKHEQQHDTVDTPDGPVQGENHGKYGHRNQHGQVALQRLPHHDDRGNYRRHAKDERNVCDVAPISIAEGQFRGILHCRNGRNDHLGRRSTEPHDDHAD